MVVGANQYSYRHGNQQGHFVDKMAKQPGVGQHQRNYIHIEHISHKPSKMQEIIMKTNKHNLRRSFSGFTLIELMVVVVILGIVMAGIVQVLITSQNAKRDLEQIAQAQQEARIVLDLVSDDIRSAGYGIDELGGQLAIARAAPFDLIMNANLFPYPDDIKNPGAPQSMKNSSTPKPGSSGTLLYNANYTNSAETIRYTFDSNNDGVVNVNDRGDDIEERIMRNDSLYSLVKQVFGYNTSSASNGGVSNSVAIGRLNFPARSSGRPVEPLFKYWVHEHLWGDANGDGVLSDAEATALYAATGGGLVPQDSLMFVTKVEITFTGQTASTFKGRYKTFTVSTMVNITRNRVLKDARAINGMVYVDQNNDKVHQSLEPGVQNAIVTLNTGVVCSTSASGEYH